MSIPPAGNLTGTAFGKILIIDDDGDLRKVLRLFLEDKKYVVFEASNGEDGVNLLDEESIDLVILDVVMPGIDGYETLQRIRTRFALGQLPVIMLSSMSEEKNIIRGLELGANDYVTKPPDFKILSARIGTHISLRQLVYMLNESDDRYQILLHTLPDIIYKLDIDGNITFINSTVRKLGYEPEELIGKHFKEVIHPEDFKKISRKIVLLKYKGKVTGNEKSPKLFDERRASERGTTELEVRLVRKNIDEPGNTDEEESFIYGEVISSGEYYESRIGNQEFKGSVGIIRDVTKRRRALDEQSRLQEQMQYIQKMDSLGVLAGGIAHDFNNLLMGILGNASLTLMDLPEDSPLRHSIEQIEIASLRAKDLTNQLLAYAGRGKFEIKPINISKFVLEMTNLLDRILSKKSSLKFELDDDIPLIDGDQTQIRQVIMNLIINASDALQDKPGIIHIKSGVCNVDDLYVENLFPPQDLETGDYVYLDIIDNGIGMDKSTMTKIFDPFFSTKVSGKGLGLASVIGIIRGQKGAIHVESTLNEGSMFRILFPVAFFVEVEPKKVETVDPDWMGSGTVLIIDDEMTVHYVAEKILQKSGFETISAISGVDGIDLFKNNSDKIVAVLLDLTMPEMSGEEVILKLREIDSNVRVLLSSGYDKEDTLSRYKETGATGYIQKPYRAAELKAAIKGMFNKD